MHRPSRLRINLMPPSVFDARRDYSISSIENFRRTLVESVPELARWPNLCIYTTGSFGRYEAGEYSDLDLFFVVDGKQKDIPRLSKILIDADLIRLCQGLGYPEFSGDGEYLKIHALDDLSKKIGDQNEDAENIFTARMLLFLESVPLHNDEVYNKAIKACITEYCRDHHDHARNFRPIFLVNDISRFWKTLCLNYESARTGLEPEDKPKHRVKNLKLKFSRMMTCYSMVACLCDPGEGDSPEKLERLVGMKPYERLEHITKKHELHDLFGQLVSEYEWFLDITNAKKSIVRQDVTDQKDEVFRRASLFGDLIYRLLLSISEKTNTDLRFLVV